MYVQNTGGGGASSGYAAEGLDPATSAQPVQGGFDEASLRRLRDELIPMANRQNTPIEEVLVASLEFFIAGSTAGFDEAARYAGARGAKDSGRFDARSRSVPELTKSLIDRGRSARLVLSIDPVVAQAFESCWTRGLGTLPATRQQLIAPDVAPRGSSGGGSREVSTQRTSMWREVEKLNAGQALVLFPASGAAEMLGRRADGSWLGVAAKDLDSSERGQAAVLEGEFPLRRLQMALALPGRQAWAMIVPAGDPSDPR